ncbi:hypothetical protein DSO57_1017542 [Entomophthora muscae]|uniref:Uncharacterized protein n=1 Tax=Entomophthora muscae TaxID=34485 RepID=A0ACC2U2Y2_9FUNG|nr:hypothetical protein DSO57_1017542 [Entomophthora muscae]
MFLSLLIVAGAYARCGTSVHPLTTIPNPINGQVLMWADENTEGAADPSFLMIHRRNFLWASSGHDFVNTHLIKKHRLKQLASNLESQLLHTQPKANLLQAKLMYRWYKGQKISRLIKCPPERRCTITSFWVDHLGWFTALEMHQTNSTGWLELAKYTHPLKYQFHIYGGTAGYVYFNKLLLNIFAVYNTTHVIDGCPLSATSLVESSFHPSTSAQPNGIIGFVTE